MRRIYNQKNTSVTVDGHNVQGFVDSASVVLTIDGGEVTKSAGTDGSSINIGADQGAALEITIRETSPSFEYLVALGRLQRVTGEGGVVIVRTGADILVMMTNTIISLPGQISTGGKEQGGIKFTLTATECSLSNLFMV